MYVDSFVSFTCSGLTRLYQNAVLTLWRENKADLRIHKLVISAMITFRKYNQKPSLGELAKIREDDPATSRYKYPAVSDFGEGGLGPDQWWLGASFSESSVFLPTLIHVCRKDMQTYSKSAPLNVKPEGSNLKSVTARMRSNTGDEGSRAAQLAEALETATQSGHNARNYRRMPINLHPQQAPLAQISAAEETESDVEDVYPSPTTRKVSTRSSVRLKKKGKTPPKKNDGYVTDAATTDVEADEDEKDIEADDEEDVEAEPDDEGGDEEEEDEEKELKVKRQKTRQAAFARKVRSVAAAKGACPCYQVAFILPDWLRTVSDKATCETTGSKGNKTPRKSQCRIGYEWLCR